MPDAPTATSLLRDGFILLGSALAFVLLFRRLGLGATPGLQIETGDVRAARDRIIINPSARGGGGGSRAPPLIPSMSRDVAQSPSKARRVSTSLDTSGTC